MRLIRASIIVLCSVFCLFLVSDFLTPATAETGGAARDCVDNDGDSWCQPEDCNDDDPSIYPGAAEIPGDAIDQNCDGSDAAVCYADVDGDGFGDLYNSFFSADGDCSDPGEAATGTDCDDSSNSVYPGAPEVPNDGIDQDCDGSDLITIPVERSTWSRIKALYGR